MFVDFFLFGIVFVILVLFLFLPLNFQRDFTLLYMLHKDNFIYVLNYSESVHILHSLYFIFRWTDNVEIKLLKVPKTSLGVLRQINK